MHLRIKQLDGNEYYNNHSTYHQGDAGLDLFCPMEITIPAKSTVFVNLHISCMAGCSYYLYPRSSISKTPLRLANSVGIIDSQYTGPIIAAVDNISNDDYIVQKGVRLFQLCSPDLSPITFELVDALEKTRRGSGGFGSTGL